MGQVDPPETVVSGSNDRLTVIVIMFLIFSPSYETRRLFSQWIRLFKRGISCLLQNTEQPDKSKQKMLG